MSESRLPAQKRRRGIAEPETSPDHPTVAVISMPTHASTSPTAASYSPATSSFTTAAPVHDTRMEGSSVAVRSAGGVGVASPFATSPSTAAAAAAQMNINNNIFGSIPKATRLATHIEFKTNSFAADYELGEVLGHGTFSIVRRCIHRATGERRAVKIIDTAKFRLAGFKSEHRDAHVNPSTLGASGPTKSDAMELPPQLLDEVRILSALSSHPHILTLFEIYSEQTVAAENGAKKHAIMIVTEWAKGGELFDSIIKAGNFNEAQARYVGWQVMSALEYMHSSGIIHRDLKPENILVFDTLLVPAEDPVVKPHVKYPSLQPNAPVPPTRTAMLQIKVADFGVARYIGSAVASGASTFVGSPQYVAPEILIARQLGKSASYGKPVDMYSLGVILYVCLAGYLPFDDHAPRPADAPVVPGETWEDRAKHGRFYFAPPVWTHISDAAKDLIKRMMHPDPAKRINMAEAMAHPWFAPLREPSEMTLPDISRLHVGSDGAPRYPSVATGEPGFSTALTHFSAPVGQIMGAGPTLQFSPGSVPQPLPFSIHTGGIPASSFTVQPPPSSTSSSPFVAFGQPSPSTFAAARASSVYDFPSSSSFASQMPSIPSSGAPTAGAMHPLGPLPREYQMHVLQAVARSLDLEMLMTLQKATADTFKAAYNAVIDIPQAAMVVRRHAVHSRDLQLHGIKKVMLRCRSIAESILGMLPDLMESIVENDKGLTQGCFERMRQWVGELKAEAQTIKTAYSGLIAEVQMSLEQARSMQAAGGDATSSKMMDMPTSSPLDAHDAMHLESGVRTPSFEFDHMSRTSTSESPAADKMYMPEPPHASPMRSNMSPPLTGPGSPLTNSIRPERAAALAEAVLSGSIPHSVDSKESEGDAFMELLLDPPSLLGEPARLQRAWASVQANQGADSTHLPVPPTVSGMRQASAESRAASATSSVPEAAMQPFKRASNPGECLMWALAALRNVDELLSQAIEFWTSMELITDVVARRKEHSETLLKYSSSARMISKATASLQDYSAFWHAFAYVCGSYADSLTTSTREMYGWLSTSTDGPELLRVGGSSARYEPQTPSSLSSENLDSMLAGSNMGRNPAERTSLDGFLSPTARPS